MKRGRFYLIACSILSCLCAFPICTQASDTIHVYVSSRDTIRHIAVRNVYDGDTLPVRFHGTYRNVRVWNKQEGDTLRHFIIPRQHFGGKGLSDTVYVSRISQFRKYNLARILGFLVSVSEADNGFTVFRRPVEKVFVNKKCLQMGKPKSMKYLRKIKGKKVETIYVIPYTGDDRLGPPEIQVKKKRSWFYRLFKSSGK